METKNGIEYERFQPNTVGPPLSGGKTPVVGWIGKSLCKANIHKWRLIGGVTWLGGLSEHKECVRCGKCIWMPCDG